MTVGARSSRRWILPCVAGALALILCSWMLTLHLVAVEWEENADADGQPTTHRSRRRSRTNVLAEMCGPGYVLEKLPAAGVDGKLTQCAPCPRGTFSYSGWLTCRPHVSCDDLSGGAVRISRYLASGAVKHVFLGQYTAHSSIPVAYAVANQHHEDFGHHIDVLKELSPHARVVQLLGACQNRYVVTQYWKLGHAGNIENVLSRRENSRFNTVAVRYGLALDLVSSLVLLHRHHYVMCDGNDIAKLLSQFLITDDWRLVVNDLDAAALLPRLGNGERGTITCGHRQLYAGDMIAPEQLWPFIDQKFDDARMPGYNEKIDVWRMPIVVRSLLGTSANSTAALEHLSSVFEQCRLHEPLRRPSAQQVLDELVRVQRVLQLNTAVSKTCPELR